MIVCLASARLLGFAAEFGLFLRGNLLEAMVALPALACLAVWHHRTRSGGP